MIEAVRAYLALLREPPATTIEALRALAKTLDQLAGAYHEAEPVDVEDHPDPPTLVTYEELRAQAVRAFPDFGYYAVARPLDVLAGDALVGDAIDDLADIARDILAVEWRWLNNGAADATWAFRWGYGNHWGRHLHDLRGYVHARRFEGPERIEPICD